MSYMDNLLAQKSKHTFIIRILSSSNRCVFFYLVFMPIEQLKIQVYIFYL